MSIAVDPIANNASDTKLKAPVITQNILYLCKYYIMNIATTFESHYIGISKEKHIYYRQIVCIYYLLK